MANDANVISVINDALALIGHPAIHDLTGKTPGSEKGARLYALVFASILAAYPWRFAMMQKQLSRLSADPLTKWDHAYQLPADRGAVPRRYYSDVNGSVIGQWEIYGETVHTNTDTVYCDYVKPGAMSGPFRNLLVRALASDLALSLSDDRTVRDTFRREAYGTPRQNGRGGLFQQTMSQDAQGAEQRSVIKIGRGPLVEAMHGGTIDPGFLG